MVLPVAHHELGNLIEGMDLKYPLYADPAWKSFRAYETGFGGPLPSQGWAVLDGDGILRWQWRAMEKGSKVLEEFPPMPKDVLDVIEKFQAEGTPK